MWHLIKTVSGVVIFGISIGIFLEILTSGSLWWTFGTGLLSSMVIVYKDFHSAPYW